MYKPMKMEQSVPKRRHIKFRRRGITQKKAYNTSYSFQILMKLEFSRQISEKNIQKSNFMKIPLVGVELYHAHGRTDVAKQLVSFGNFAKSA